MKALLCLLLFPLYLLADSALFLDPYIKAVLQDIEDKTVLDAGCGMADWAIYAAQQGAYVVGIEKDKQALAQARQRVEELDLRKITLTLGDVSRIPLRDRSCHRTLSINVACQLPSTGVMETEEGELIKVGLGPHVKDFWRVTKKRGIALFVVPCSIDVLFTRDVDQEVLRKQIWEVLAGIVPESDIAGQLSELDDVLHGTFAWEDGGLVLVEDEFELVPGQEIWRKCPSGAQLCYYHPFSEYVMELEAAGFITEGIYQGCFESEVELRAFNGQAQETERLGEAYVGNAPYSVFYLRKTKTDSIN